MRVIEIKGKVPGTGKTTLLVKHFVTTEIPNKVLLCPTHRGRQICIEKAIELGMNREEAEKSIKTLEMFKGNGSPYYAIKHSKPHYGKIWNIFIDDSHMIPKEKMDDLIKNWRILNLIIANDPLQFVVDECPDNGTPYDLHIDHQILLNKPLRSIDPKLTKAINLVKEGKIVEAFNLLHYDNTDKSEYEYKDTDWHITYTKRLRDTINEMYKNPRRFIITTSDPKYKFWKSEILDIEDKRFVQLNDMLIEAHAKDPKVPLFDEWLKIHAAPAQAVTYHDIQGTTISKGKIYIHLEDLSANIPLSDKERAEIVQRFLYVAISRATRSDQIVITEHSDDEADYILKMME